MHVESYFYLYIYFIEFHLPQNKKKWITNNKGNVEKSGEET